MNENGKARGRAGAKRGEGNRFAARSLKDLPEYIVAPDEDGDVDTVDGVNVGGVQVPEADVSAVGVAVPQVVAKPDRAAVVNVVSEAAPAAAVVDTYKVSFEVDAAEDVRLSTILAGRRWSYGRKVGKAAVLRAALLAVLHTIDVGELSFEHPDSLEAEIVERLRDRLGG